MFSEEFEQKATQIYLSASSDTINRTGFFKDHQGVQFLGLEIFCGNYIAWFSNFGCVVPYDGKSLLERRRDAEENNESSTNIYELNRGADHLFKAKLSGAIPKGLYFLRSHIN